MTREEFESRMEYDAGNPSYAQTAICYDGNHGPCDGHIAPKVYSNTRPCKCECHTDS